LGELKTLEGELLKDSIKEIGNGRGLLYSTQFFVVDMFFGERGEMG
jgi:hypothetical protein